MSHLMPLNPWYEEEDDDIKWCSCGSICDPGREHYGEKDRPQGFVTPFERATELGVELSWRDMRQVSRRASHAYGKRHPSRPQPPRWNWRGWRWFTIFDIEDVDLIDTALRAQTAKPLVPPELLPPERRRAFEKPAPKKNKKKKKKKKKKADE